MSSSYKRKKDHHAFLAQCLGKTDHIQMSNYSGITDWCATHFGASNAAVGNGPAEFLGEIVLNDDATAEITTEIQGGLDYYVLELNCVTPATDDTYLILECSTDGGSTWHTTSGDYGYDTMWVDSSSGTKTTVLGYVASNILIGNVNAGNRQGNATNESISGYIHVGNLDNTSYEKGFKAFTTWISPTGVRWTSVTNGLFVANTNAVDGFRFRFASGNLKNGKIKVVGRQKTL